MLVKGARVPCRVLNVSTSGALVDQVMGFPVGAHVEIDLPQVGRAIGVVVRATPTQVALAFPGLLVISPLL